MPSSYALRLTPYALRQRQRLRRALPPLDCWLEVKPMRESGTNPAPAEPTCRKANKTGAMPYLDTVGVAGSNPAPRTIHFPQQNPTFPRIFKAFRNFHGSGQFPVASASHPPERRNADENTAPKRHQKWAKDFFRLCLHTQPLGLGSDA